MIFGGRRRRNKNKDGTSSAKSVSGDCVLDDSACSLYCLWEIHNTEEIDLDFIMLSFSLLYSLLFLANLSVSLNLKAKRHAQTSSFLSPSLDSLEKAVDNSLSAAAQTLGRREISDGNRGIEDSQYSSEDHKARALMLPPLEREAFGVSYIIRRRLDAIARHQVWARRVVLIPKLGHVDFASCDLRSVVVAGSIVRTAFAVSVHL